MSNMPGNSDNPYAVYNTHAPAPVQQTGGIFQKGKLLIVHKQAVLPDRCIKSNDSRTPLGWVVQGSLPSKIEVMSALADGTTTSMKTVASRTPSLRMYFPCLPDGCDRGIHGSL